MDQYFKMERAKEEIVRLNIEIRQLVIFICDEDEYLKAKRVEWEVKDICIAIHIDIYRRSKSRFNARHLARLTELSRMAGFTGTILPGIRLRAEMSIGGEAAAETEAVMDMPEGGISPEDDDDTDDDAAEVEAPDYDAEFACQFELLQIVSDD